MLCEDEMQKLNLVKDFNYSELLLIMEFARVGMSDGDTYDAGVELMDIDDATMKALQKKLEEATDGT